jgi:hypothetical protein
MQIGTADYNAETPGFAGVGREKNGQLTLNFGLGQGIMHPQEEGA